MPLKREQTAGRARTRPWRLALASLLVLAGIVVPAAPAAAAPLLTAAPNLDRSGRTLFTDDGAWLPGGNTYTYSWERCDAAVVTCTAVPGRTANAYLLTTADIGKRIRSVVTAHNSLLGAGTAASAATNPIVASPPLNSVPPSIAEGATTLTSTLGTWTDPSPGSVVYSRQWQRCSGGDALSCQNVTGQTAAAYPLTAADNAKFIRVVVSAEGLGRSSVPSAPVGPVMTLPAAGGGGVTGGGGSGGGSGGNSNGTAGTPPSTALRKLRPFPKVIVAGRLKRGRTVISGLAVRGGPRGASVTVTCRGRGCPRGGTFRGKLSRSGSLKLKRFQRTYVAGALLEIRITQPGAIGKFTRLRVRARSIPARRDACLMPGSSKPARCP